MSTHSYLTSSAHRHCSPQLSCLRPFSWLARGWQDMMESPKASFAHGAAVMTLALVSLILASSHLFILAATLTGFLLIGPILGAGLCEISRRHETQPTVSFDESLSCIDRHEHSLLQFSTILLSMGVFWLLLSGILLSLFIEPLAPPLTQTLWGSLYNALSPAQIMLYLAVGGTLAIAIFVLSVVTVPLIIDQDSSEMQAMQTSLHVALANPLTMLVWATLLLLLTVIGFVSFLLGLVVVFPLLGHATWHAYRDLIPGDRT